jgi:putative transposase
LRRLVTDRDAVRSPKGRAATADVCRKHGINDAALYKWKAKFSELDVSDARRPKALEDGNARQEAR